MNKFSTYRKASLFFFAPADESRGELLGYGGDDARQRLLQDQDRLEMTSQRLTNSYQVRGGQGLVFSPTSLFILVVLVFRIFFYTSFYEDTSFFTNFYKIDKKVKLF